MGIHTLAERNGWIYIKETTIDYFEPRTITSYWPVGLRLYQFAQWFGSEELAKEALNKQVSPTSNTSFIDERNWTYRLVNGGQTLPDFTDIEPIPEPKHNKNTRVIWQSGQWYKETSKGRVRC
jgi:hypothetical protein